MRYEVKVERQAAKALGQLDPPVRRRVVAVIAALADDPRPAGCKALVGRPGQLRVRVGDWRVIYVVRDSAVTVTVVEVGHRRDIYG